MGKKFITAQVLREFERYLISEERSDATRENYLRGVRAYAAFLGGGEADAEQTRRFKEHLERQNYARSSINTMLASLFAFFKFMGWTDCGTKRLRTQKTAFAAEERILTKAEYERLARVGGRRDRLIVQTVGSTGIRVSELSYFTVEAVKKGIVEVYCKAKTRQILIQGKLKRELLRYAKRKGIKTGAIFLSRSGKPLSRGSIWALLKRLAKMAGVAASKVFPHNLRKLFARVFYAVSRDIAKLADVLGHSSIETTRLYIMDTGEEHRRALERMRLLV